MDKFNLTVAENKIHCYKKQIQSLAKIAINAWIQTKCLTLNLTYGDMHTTVKSFSDLKKYFMVNCNMDSSQSVGIL